MSRIGKKPISIPSGVRVQLDGDVVRVMGPKGELNVDLRGKVDLDLDGSSVVVKLKAGDNTQYQGLYRALLTNAIEGVLNGFVKKLEVVGVGYKVSLNGSDLVLNLGYSHPVVIQSVEGVKFEVDGNVISVIGIDKVLVGDIAAKIRAVRPPDPYKGKGVRYLGERVVLKERKSSK